MIRFSRRQVMTGAVAGVSMPFASRLAIGQAYPSREVRVVGGFPAGVGPDIFIRFLAERLREMTGQPMVVENRIGAGGSIASEHAVRAKPDGYTLLIQAGSAQATYPYLYKSLSFDPLKDLTPVTTLVKFPFVLVVPANAPYNTVGQLVETMLKKGDKASYGYSANIFLACGELLKARTGIRAVGVPYKSTTDGLNELLSGVIDYHWTDFHYANAQVQAGRLKILGVTSAEPTGLAPSLPTIQQGGIKDFDIVGWWGAWYPPKTPQPIVDSMAKWLNDILLEPRTQEFLRKTFPADAFPGDPAKLQSYLAQEIPKWANLLQIAKVERQ